MKAYKEYTAGQTADFNVGVAGFVMDKGTAATFEGYNSETFQLTTTNEPQLFQIGIAGITVSSGRVTILG